MNNPDTEILLVEDSTEDAEMTIRALKKINLANKLIHVEDGQEALDFLFAEGRFANRKGQNPPKVILLDIKMPRVDGIEVLRRIRENESTRHIPVVIMTSSNDERDIVAGYQLGVNSYVVKPVDFAGFASAVSDLGMYWMLINQSPGNG